jgi:Holliday junction resolvase
MKTESQIEAQLVRYCREQGIYTRKFSSPSHRGVPDRICIKGGVVIFLELKRPGNVATALQLREIAELRRHRVHAFVATGFTEAVTILQQFMPADASDAI